MHDTTPRVAQMLMAIWEYEAARTKFETELEMFLHEDVPPRVKDLIMVEVTRVIETFGLHDEPFDESLLGKG